MVKKFTPFATSIWSTNVDIDEETHKKIIEFVYSLKEQDEGLNVSNSLGWHSSLGKNINWNNFDTSPITFLFDKLKECNMEVMSELNLTEDGWSYITTDYWFNVNGKGAANYSHDHPDNSLSGVLYLKKPENSGRIIFERTDSQHWAMPYSNDFTKPGTDNRCNYYCLETEELEYVVFPASLRHSVEPNLSDEDRISMAINYRVRK